jgi:hypothetical protein
VHYRLIDYLLWLACPLLQAGILVALLRRRLSRDYRYFFDYTVLQVATAIILAILAASSYTGYYYAYYVNLALSVLVSFAVVWEILKTSLGRRGKVGRSGLFPILCLVALVIAALAMFLTTGMPHQPVTKLLMLSDRALRIVQIGVLLLFAVFGVFLGAFRRTFVFGVGLGFGVFAVVNMIIAFALSSHRALTSVALSKINSIAYLVACTIWLLYAICGSSEASGFGRLPLLLSLTDNKGGSKSPTRWSSRVGFLQSRTAVES